MKHKVIYLFKNKLTIGASAMKYFENLQYDFNLRRLINSHQTLVTRSVSKQRERSPWNAINMCRENVFYVNAAFDDASGWNGL